MKIWYYLNLKTFLDNKFVDRESFLGLGNRIFVPRRLSALVKIPVGVSLEINSVVGPNKSLTRIPAALRAAGTG